MKPRIVSENALTDSQLQIKDTVDRVLHEEAEAIMSFLPYSEKCIAAVEKIDAATGPLIVAGIGKSGHIAKKLASTFRSLGQLAIYLHPAEASHGDLGLVEDNSVVLALSNSGETTELSDLLQYCSTRDIPIISITSRADNTLGRASDICISYGDLREACHKGLAPTTSTTLSLAIGDAIAVSLSALRGKVEEDFRRFHPGGKLGARLTTVRDLMREGNEMPILSQDATLEEVVLKITEKSLGMVVFAEERKLLGVLTDGDLRRHIDKLRTAAPFDMATKEPVRVTADIFASEAASMMSLRGITACVVEDEVGQLIGVLHVHDCVRAGVA